MGKHFTISTDKCQNIYKDTQKISEGDRRLDDSQSQYYHLELILKLEVSKVNVKRCAKRVHRLILKQ